MTPKNFLLLFSLIGILAVACSGEVPPQRDLDRPRLSEEDALGLVSTYLQPHLVKGDPLGRCLFAGTRSAEYLGEGTWVTRFTGCTFLVDDHTGKVTGP